MANKKTKVKEGFTIIEVVLVLAIAGLIFLMVFVALPALQRSQRDTQRRDDMARVNNALVNYQTNNDTNLPAPGEFDAPDDDTYPDNCTSSTACRLVRDYLNTSAGSAEERRNTFKDPDGLPYSVVITDNLASKNPGTSFYVSSKQDQSRLTGDPENGYLLEGDAQFDARVIYIATGAKCDGEMIVPAERRHFAVLYRLEGAGVSCTDSQ